MTRRLLLSLPFVGALAKAVGVKCDPGLDVGLIGNRAICGDMEIVVDSRVPKNEIWIINPGSFATITNLQDLPDAHR